MTFRMIWLELQQKKLLLAMERFDHNRLTLHVQKDFLKDGELMSEVVASSTSGKQD